MLAKAPVQLREEGKQRSRCNAVRHGLTAETVIGALEDAEDYKAFEAAIIADYDAQSAVERELVLRLASLLWRLRRATTMETGLFEIQADHLREFRQAAKFTRSLGKLSMRCSGGLIRSVSTPIQHRTASQTERKPCPAPCRNLSDLPSIRPLTSRVAFCVSPICPATPLDRLSRYEAILWRQAGQILFALDALDRRKPQDRGRRFRIGSRQDLRVYVPEEC